MDQAYDIVIAGGGLAGLTAGLTAARLGRKTLVLTGDVIGGQLLSIEKIEGFPGFPEAVRSGAVDRKPHLMASYLVELASTFNEFYRDCPVLNEKDPARREARLALVDMTREILSRGLWSLGIDSPRKM